MKEMPWVDICTSEQWTETVNQFASGKSRSRGKNFVNVMRFLFTKKLPREVTELTQLIENYHNMEKRDLDNVQARQPALRAIARTGQRYLDHYKVTGRGGIERDRIYERVFGSYDRLMKKDADFSHNVGKMESGVIDRWDREEIDEPTAQNLMVKGRQDLLEVRAKAEYKKAKLESFDYAVSKVVRRATRKADYLAKLTQHLHGAEGTHRHMASGQQTLIRYVQDRAAKHIDADLIRLHSDEILEKIDPWHRNYEVSLSTQGYLVPNDKTTSSIYGRAFMQWFRDEQHPDLPFFVWLEGHEACTGPGDKDAGGSVGYGGVTGEMQIDSGPAASIHVLDSVGGVVKVMSIRETDEVGDKDFDTQHIGGGGKTNKKMAFVWGRDNLVYVAPHVATRFHHSSFLSGKKVRCSGMIGAQGGKIVYVDNDSGHYKPSDKHLHSFVDWLKLNGYLSEEAVVVVKPKVTKIPVEDFLAGRTGAVAQRLWERFQAKEVDLRGLVEERFQELKQASGRGQPDQAVWKNAWVSICQDLGQFDSSYLRKAEAPPLPRTRAPSRG